MKKILLVLSFLMFSACSYALISDIGIDPLDQTSGAKPLGLGGAFVAASNDINCLFYNPASLAHSKGIIATAKDIKNYSVGVAYETSMGNFGVGTVNKSYEEIAGKDVKTKYENGMTLFGYGTGYDWLSIGFTLKSVLMQRLSITGIPDISDNFGSDYDAGILWKPVNFASIGYMIRNGSNSTFTLGSSQEVFPRATRTGFSVDILGANSIFSSEAFGLKAAYDAETGDVSEETKQNSYYGIEGSFNNWFFVRFGGSSVFKIDSYVASSSLGLGFKYQDTEIDLVGLKDPITEGQVSYVSLSYSPSYSPREFVLFKEPEEVQTAEVKPVIIKKNILRIDFPQDDHTTYNENIIISGETRPKAIVLINGVHAYVENDGKFKAIQPLIPGKNLIEISAGLDNETKTIFKKVLRKAKVIIEEEKEVNKRIVQEVLNKEAELSKRSEEIKIEKEKGVDVTQKERILVEEKTKAEETKVKLLEERKTIQERKEKVENLVTLGVIEVSPEAKFEIEAPITRGEMISWLVKASGIAIPKVEESVFSDVPKNHKYAPYIKAALDAGSIVIEPGGKFRPDEPVKENEGQEFFKAFGIVR